jgi:predicted metal-dependent phosphoesterase TrpH
MFKIDLHTHSEASPDGGISFEQYVRAIDHGLLDFIAVTDHNSIEQAKDIQKALGKKIIIGEEIMTLQGEIIGLFLTEAIKPQQQLMDTVKQIKDQGGVVYLPHPFETVRKGISEADLITIADSVDIVEVYNGRAFMQNRGPQATTWARIHEKACAASSDAHGAKGLGSAYTNIKEEPTSKNLPELILYGHCSMQRPPLRSLLYPKTNRLRKAFKKQ